MMTRSDHWEARRAEFREHGILVRGGYRIYPGFMLPATDAELILRKLRRLKRLEKKAKTKVKP